MKENHPETEEDTQSDTVYDHVSANSTAGKVYLMRNSMKIGRTKNAPEYRERTLPS